MLPKVILRSVVAILFSQPLAADWVAHYITGEEKLRRGMVEEASRDLRRAVREAESEKVGGKERAAVRDALGRARFRAGSYGEAAGHFEEAVRLAEGVGERVASLVNGAQAYREMGEWKKAEKMVRAALAGAPEDGRIWQLLGSVLVKGRRYEAAKEAEEKAVAYGGGRVAALAWSDLAVMEEARERYGEAARYLQRAIGVLEAGQERGRMLVNLGVMEQKAKEEEKAVEHIRQGIAELEEALGKAHADLAGALDAYAGVLTSVGRKGEARAAAERAGEMRAFLGAAVHVDGLRRGGRR